MESHVRNPRGILLPSGTSGPAGNRSLRPPGGIRAWLNKFTRERYNSRAHRGKRDDEGLLRML
eukprot:1156233-Prorocentrum_minimum.AAC.1